jgi:predicted permease
VMPQDFHFAPFWITQAEMWAPLDLSKRLHQYGFNSLRVFARLKPGVSIIQAQAEANQLSANLASAFPDTNAKMRVQVESLTEKSVGRLRTGLELLLGAVGMVLLIACANVANLALARATARQKEIAIRLSLGARRFQIARQFLAESLVLSLAGGAAGLLLAQWGMFALRAMLRPDAGTSSVHLQRWNEIGLNTPVLLFTLAIALATGILSGLAPALSAARRSVGHDMSDSLKDGGRGSSSVSGSSLRKVLVAAEIAIALVLLIGAGLLTRSFVKLRAIDPGFDPNNVVAMTVSVAGRPDYIGAAREIVYRSIVDRVSAVPGVRSVSMTNHLPIAGDRWRVFLGIEGRPLPAPGDELATVYRVTRPNYFATMRAPLLKGRDFTEHDDANTPRVAIINETIADHLFPNEDPLGKRIAFNARTDPQWMIIVGVIKDMKQDSWSEIPSNEVHIPFLQDDQFLNSSQSVRSAMTLVVRTNTNADAAIPSIKNAVWSVDRNLPLSQVQTLDHAIGNATWESRFSLLLTGLFSTLALVLAMIGIYGVMSYEVAQRTHEIGIRMALGAARGAILRMVARQSLPVALVGIACGLGAAAGFVRLMRTMLYQVDALDPLTFIGVAALVLVVAVAATLIPARDAMRVDPMVALRRE